MTEPAMSDQIARAFSGRRVLVTGGAGFVGGALVRRLAEADAKVTVLDDLFTGRPDTIPDGAQLVRGSVVDEDLVRSLVAESSGRVPHGRPEHHREHEGPASGLRHEHRRDA